MKIIFWNFDVSKANLERVVIEIFDLVCPIYKANKSIVINFKLIVINWSLLT